MLPEGGANGSGKLLPLYLEATSSGTTVQPVRVGLPLARGLLHEPGNINLRDGLGRSVSCQVQSLARWPDGSIRWLLLDFMAGTHGPGRHDWAIHLGPGIPVSGQLTIESDAAGFTVDTKLVQFHLNTTNLAVSARGAKGTDLLGAEGARWVLTDPEGRVASSRVERVEVETSGPLRATIRLEGRFDGSVSAHFVTRLSFHADTALVRIDFTLHNPRRAKHPGGLWDLGDPGSMLFRDLALRLPLGGTEPTCTRWSPASDRPARSIANGGVEIYQGGSGGENWQSPSHLNREGRVPCSLRGYRVRAGGEEETGLRASPVVSLADGTRAVTVAISDFWQQFPKALETSDRAVRVRLFPAQFGDLFELQGGEQKTHTVWLDLASEEPGGLAWVASPLHAHFPPAAYSESGVLAHLVPGPGHEPFEKQAAEVVDGPRSFFSGRETIDEYGWRNYGEVFADHEEEHYAGPKPFVSHYNNQYDLVLGSLQQYFRCGDGRWLSLAGPLARHVCDIDIYHTTCDKAAYNGGLFWFTDHYLSAHTCTHRTYSVRNRPVEGDYGGGPSSNHLFSTGLLFYYYLTGDPVARDAVLELAEWVLGMDDGSANLLGLIDPGPTGLASFTGAMSYHGPGRGCGNSVNTLLDAWLLTSRRQYLGKAEELIRRSVHPEDDIEARNLLDVEKRWSYTVFLCTLARYLGVKAEAEECDTMYAYGRASLLRYAEWMLENEVPYFDRPEQLEYPTEAWAGQELRKANVLRLAAEYAGPSLRPRLLARGRELADRAWDDLYRFAARTTARGQALVLAEGPRDDYFRRCPPREMPETASAGAFSPLANFVPQKQRVLARIRSPLGLARAILGLFDLRRWGRLLADRTPPLR